MVSPDCIYTNTDIPGHFRSLLSVSKSKVSGKRGQIKTNSTVKTERYMLSNRFLQKHRARITLRKYKRNSSLNKGKSSILCWWKKPIFNTEGWICGLLLKVPNMISQMVVSTSFDSKWPILKIGNLVLSGNILEIALRDKKLEDDKSLRFDIVVRYLFRYLLWDCVREIDHIATDGNIVKKQSTVLDDIIQRNKKQCVLFTIVSLFYMQFKKNYVTNDIYSLVKKSEWLYYFILVHKISVFE